MDPKKVAAAFNLWMEKFTNNPAAFEAEFQTVARFIDERGGLGEPSYGETCTAYLQELMVQVP